MGAKAKSSANLEPLETMSLGVFACFRPHGGWGHPSFRLALRPEAEQALVRGLVPLKAEGKGAVLPPVEAFESAARAEAKLLGLKRAGEEESEATEREVDAPTVPLGPRHKKPGSTTVNLRRASKDLTWFAVVAVGISLGAFALIWWWANRTSVPGVPRVSPSAEVEVPKAVPSAVLPVTAPIPSSVAIASSVPMQTPIPSAASSAKANPKSTRPSVPTTAPTPTPAPKASETALPIPVVPPTPPVPTTQGPDPLHLQGM